MAPNWQAWSAKRALLAIPEAALLALIIIDSDILRRALYACALVVLEVFRDALTLGDFACKHG